MQVFLTFDYELFFGDNSGSVSKCLIEPTDKLLYIAKKTKCVYTFFVDVGYLVKLESYKLTHPNLAKELSLIKAQLHQIIQEGHDIQLHIHPHWEKSFYNHNGWQMNTQNYYRLHDFSHSEIEQIVSKYKSYLEELIHRPVHAFRAGGWCIQPFDHLYDIFKKHQIRIDSSVMRNAKMESGNYYFNFMNAPDKDIYKFEKDILSEKENGFFTEYPISSRKYSPLFYWKLYLLGRLNPSNHKMIGDGSFMAQPGRKKSVLTKSTWNHLSMDGYYSSMLIKAKKELEAQHKKNMVVIGHPKGMTKYSFSMLYKFIISLSKTDSFSTFNALK